MTKLSTPDDRLPDDRLRNDRLRADRVAQAELRDARKRLRAAEFDAGLRDRPRRIGTIVPILLCLAAVVGCGIAVSGWLRASSDYSDSDYEHAAAQHVALLLSPDFRSPEVARRILDGATGEFHDEFAQSADSYTQFVRSRGTVGRAAVMGTGVSGRVDDGAVVLVAASVTFAGEADNQHVSSSGAQPFRLRVLITPADGTLKMSAVQYLP